LSGRTLVVDFDGTITEQDLLDEIAQTFGDEEVYKEVDEGLDDHSLTLNEVIRREFEPVRAPLAEVQDWVLENVRVRPGFHDVVELARERGWRFVIVSSGFRELIEPVLELEGLTGVELLSNSVDPDPAGWKVRFRVSETCEVCDQPCGLGQPADSLVTPGEIVHASERVGVLRAQLRFLQLQVLFVEHNGFGQPVGVNSGVHRKPRCFRKNGHRASNDHLVAEFCGLTGTGRAHMREAPRHRRCCTGIANLLHKPIDIEPVRVATSGQKSRPQGVIVLQLRLWRLHAVIQNAGRVYLVGLQVMLGVRILTRRVSIGNRQRPRVHLRRIS
jgi:HAD superfamily phosphoserine phosphatase-like hydrolase